MDPKFNPFPLAMIEPSFGSKLTDMTIDLDYLRKKTFTGSTHHLVFFQLKHIFQFMESIGSARIEGNNTTVLEYVDARLGGNRKQPQTIQEIENIDNCLTWLNTVINTHPIDRMLISEVHRKITRGLSTDNGGEGDKTPGVYRKSELKINNSNHLPPTHVVVGDYMDELINFINTDYPPKYDLLKTAIVHHRFAWIHPFGNGNGRTVRILTYAMLMKQGFNIRIVNPTAVFCSNRNEYYQKLASADKGTNEGILEWCEYVLKGLKHEIEKLDKLSDYPYLQREILFPSIARAFSHQYITELEAKILNIVVEKQKIQASDLIKLFEGKNNSLISKYIKKLIDKKMLIPEEQGKRKYLISFDNSELLRIVIKLLDEKGFLPIHINN